MYKYETSLTGSYELLKQNAKANRKCPTEAEAVMWNVLRGKKFGVRFRRQHPINDYIADFVCLSHNLVIEIDGGYHTEEDVKLKDKERTFYMEKEGFAVIRFTNEQVLSDIESVIAIIKQKLYDRR